MATSLIKPKIPLSALTSTFVPFGILTSLSIWAAELNQDVLLGRSIYSIWVTYIVAIPALCLYVLGLESKKRQTYWLLWWSFAYLAYSLHVAWTFLGIFDGQLEKMFTIQGLFIAGTNVVITLWWTIDVLLAWIWDAKKSAIAWERNGIHLLFFLAAVYVGIFRKQGIITGLGIVMAVAVLICVLVRVWTSIENRKQEFQL